MKEEAIEEIEDLEVDIITNIEKVVEEATTLVIEVEEEANMVVMKEIIIIEMKVKKPLIHRMKFKVKSNKLMCKISLNMVVNSETITEEVEEITVVVVAVTLMDKEAPFIEISNYYKIKLYIEIMTTEDKIITIRIIRKTLSENSLTNLTKM